MANTILKSIAILALLSFPASGLESIMLCKDVQKIFSGTDDGQGGTQLSQLQGPPGKPGSQGPPGSPGIQGPPGVPGAIDYNKISEMIDEKIRQRSFCSIGAGYKGKIPDSSFTASSEFRPGLAARFGRVNSPSTSNSEGCWAAKTAAVGQWLQVDLGTKKSVIGVMIQGREDFDQWVTSFHVGCGSTPSSSRKISDGNGNIKLFPGNKDRNTIVSHFFRHEQCRFMRIYPQTWYGHMSMRMDFIESC